MSASLFYGLGADGTVGANKNSIKIIGQETDLYAQGYFVYDSKKSGAITISHLRTSKRPIRSAYLVERAGFVACHQFEFVDKIDVLEHAAPGAAFLLNAPFPADEVWDHLPREMQEQIIEKKIRFFAIDAYELAKRAGMGTRINTIMQTCFFAISGVLPRDEAIKHIKKAIEKTYGKRGPEVVRRNCEVVDQALAHLHEITVPAAVSARRARPPLVSERAPDFVQKVTAVMLAGKGDLLPVSAFPVDGTWPVATAKWEKRNIALEIPVWDSKICIQCNQCALVCPHAAIRAKVYDESALAGAPPTFKSTPYKGNEHKGKHFTIQVAPEDCTGCNLCVNVCPAKDRTNPKHKAIDMHPQAPLRDAGARQLRLLPQSPRAGPDRDGEDRSQELAVPRAAVRVLGRLRGLRRDAVPQAAHAALRRPAAHRERHRLLVDLRRQPADHAVHDESRRPRAGVVELALRGQRGVRLRLPPGARRARRAARAASSSSSRRRSATGLATALLDADQSSEAGIAAQRERVDGAAAVSSPACRSAEARRLETLADYLVKKSVWLVGGDGWAYDIGYGGLDHVLANRRDVNILVIDTEVYSNTGGQASKATPLGAAAKFAAAGKPVGKKDLGLLANMYGHVYVARVAFGAKMAQTAQAFLEAESYPGPSLIIAYSHCIAHGYDMAQRRVAAEAGRRLRRLAALPLRSAADSPRASRRCISTTVRRRRRSPTTCATSRASGWSSVPIPARYKTFVAESQAAAERRYAVYQQLAGITVPVFEARPTPQHRRIPTRRRRSDGPQHHVSRDAPAPSADRRRGAARRRSRHGQGARRRRRRHAGAALALRRGNHRRADGRVLQRREPQRIVRRGRQLRARADDGARARRVPRASAPGQAARSAFR